MYETIPIREKNSARFGGSLEQLIYETSPFEGTRLTLVQSIDDDTKSKNNQNVEGRISFIVPLPRLGVCFE
jgi:hypothetical protein